MLHGSNSDSQAPSRLVGLTLFRHMAPANHPLDQVSGPRISDGTTISIMPLPRAHISRTRLSLTCVLQAHAVRIIHRCNFGVLIGFSKYYAIVLDLQRDSHDVNAVSRPSTKRGLSRSQQRPTNINLRNSVSSTGAAHRHFATIHSN